MASLSTHYKEITPEQTVQNVKDFFSSNDFRLELCDVNQSEAGTWYCHLDLYYGDVLITGSNGKGVSKEYALASGHAELYERFCNGMPFIANPYWIYRMIDLNKDKGYNFRPNEKILTQEELLNSCSRVKNFFQYISQGDEKITSAAINYITNGKIIGLPLQNIDGSEPLYLDPRVMIRITRSIGMAAGNTLNEALVQGMSELVEKEAQKELFMNFDKTHAALRLENITNPTLQTIIHNIQDAGYKLYLIDLSYSYKMPVMMSVLVDPEHGVVNANFGAFPVFDIAAERVLTELYQGIASYRSSNYRGRIQVPYRNFTKDQILRMYGNSISGEVFPLQFIDNLVYEDEYNKDIFVARNTSNEELVQYFVNLGHRMNKKIYYLNNSLSDKICAIHLFLDGDISYNGLEGQVINWDIRKKGILLNELKNLSTIHSDIWNGKESYIPIINELQHFNYDQSMWDFLGLVQMWHNFLPFEKNGLSFSNLNYLLYQDTDIQQGVPNDIINSICYKQYKKYMQLRAYIFSDKYTNEEILAILNKHFDYEVTEEDIQNCNNVTYLLQKVYVRPMIDYIHGENYSKVIQIFIDNYPH